MIEDCRKIIQEKKDEVYKIAELAREKGLDSTTIVEMKQAKDLADRVEELVGPVGVAERIRELIKEHGRENSAIKIIDEIVAGKFGGDTIEKRGEQAVRTSITILTEGIVVAGTEGISKVTINENPDRSKYLTIYFASPIRSAGGSAGAYGCMVADYARKLMGLQQYRPTTSEIERYVEEVNIYNSMVSRLQYMPKEEEIRHIVKNCPVCVNGDPVGRFEVSVYRDLEGISNAVRGGMCLVMAESLAQKAPKLLKFSKAHDLGWDWLEGLVKIVKKSGKTEIKPIDIYLGDIVGGRPIFAYPSRPGGFRLRYGRARNTGINARAIHPATMRILDEFAAIGTQLKIERPKKGCALTPCDEIEPPVVRLRNGDVVVVNSMAKADKIAKDIKEILFLGDVLVSYGDFLNSDHPLVPSGICEEWWEQIAKEKGIDIDADLVTPEKAVELSKIYQIPLHPKYTYFYADLSPDDLIKLIRWLKTAEIEIIEGFEGQKIRRMITEISEEKRILERLCVPHKVREGRIIIENAEILEETLGLRKDINLDRLLEQKETTLDIINEIAGFPVYNKAPVYIGARMGRPEKAKERMMTPAPHGLLPVGNFGGKTRSLAKAADKGKITLDIPRLYCRKCKKNLFSYKCECGERAVILKVCDKCGKELEKEKCGCGGKASTYYKGIVNMKEEVQKVLSSMRERLPDKTKGVLGTTNAGKFFEPLEKTVLRAKHNVFTFKDGTSRFDATNLPLTHFRPKEIGVTVEKLLELGYTHDYLGKEITDEDQVVELLPQDIVLAIRGGEYFVRVSKFLDDLLQKFYGLEKYYNITTKEELIGHLVIGMAPHISVGSLGRIIGFTKARATYAHPYFHCACRRDCDGDEDSVMLLLDGLINFSMKYVPNKPGATEDIPKILSTRLVPSEIDDQSHDIETIDMLPLEFYEATQKTVSPTDVKIPIVKDRLGKENDSYDLKFMFDTKSIDEGPNVSRYSQLKTMAEKVERQLALAEKIRAVDEKDVAARVLNFHFLRDIYGNLRSFGQQTFRCVDCNTKYRRVPLIGKCNRCGGKILLTVHKGGIKKYLKVSQEIAEKYGLGDYLKQRLKLVEKDLEMIFESEKEKQYSLTDFM